MKKLLIFSLLVLLMFCVSTKLPETVNTEKANFNEFEKEKINADVIDSEEHNTKNANLKVKSKEDENIVKNDEDSKEYISWNPVYGKYALNNLILNYNNIAEFPLSDKKISDIKEIGRPISKITLTLDNGAYVIITYNDYSKTIFLDYQDESYDNEAIFCAFRDFSKALNRFITDEDIEKAIEELCTGAYSDYYVGQYDLCGIKINYSENVIRDGLTRFLIKCSYKL